MIGEPFLTSWLKKVAVLVGVSGIWHNLFNVVLSFEWSNILKNKRPELFVISCRSLKAMSGL